MKGDDALQKLLKSFERYYTIKSDGLEPPFSAEAEFHAHGEQYFLVKAAHIADIDSNEYVFFAEETVLSGQRLAELDSAAWEKGLSRVKPYFGHRNSDVTLIILADKIDENVFAKIKKSKHYKSYTFGLYGWSNFRTLAYELTTGRLAYNRPGKDLQKLISNL